MDFSPIIQVPGQQCQTSRVHPPVFSGLYSHRSCHSCPSPLPPLSPPRTTEVLACRQEPCCCRAPGHSEHSVLVWGTTVSLLEDQLGQTRFWFTSILFKGMEASDFFVKIMDFFSIQVRTHQGSAYSVHRYLGFQHQTRAKKHCASQTALQHWRAWGNMP